MVFSSSASRITLKRGSDWAFAGSAPIRLRVRLRMTAAARDATRLRNRRKLTSGAPLLATDSPDRQPRQSMHRSPSGRPPSGRSRLAVLGLSMLALASCGGSDRGGASAEVRPFQGAVIADEPRAALVGRDILLR